MKTGMGIVKSKNKFHLIIFFIMVALPFYIWNVYLWILITFIQMNYLPRTISMDFIDNLFIPSWLILSFAISTLITKIYNKQTDKKKFWKIYGFIYTIFVIISFIAILPFGLV